MSANSLLMTDRELVPYHRRSFQRRGHILNHAPLSFSKLFRTSACPTNLSTLFLTLLPAPSCSISVPFTAPLPHDLGWLPPLRSFAVLLILSSRLADSEACHVANS